MDIRIHNSIGLSDHLSVPSHDWQRAIKDEHLSLSEFCLYLFLADHANGDKINLSREMFEDVCGYKKTSYNDAIRTLKEKGYLVQTAEHQYEFHTKPQRINGRVPSYMFGEDEFF